ncbi:helix-turn-helix transcriptional regulator [Micromonospora sp. NBC_01699]|uniref:helix-turn-helix transcriptional regulator n=1 Tax=Micromonospora sp. NBC_01699 TaxID=2975984 RepID=UPI002E2B76BA|nr:helix-turn-helix transcriptional regulator [Micromonospora sp. NBC_01699]
MPEPTAVIPQLTRWGVSADADLVYRALALLGPRRQPELSRELGLHVGRVTAALEELAALGGAVPGTAGTGAGRRWSSAALPTLLARLRRPPSVLTDQERWRHHLHALDGLDLPAVDSTAVRRWPSRALTRRRVAHLVAAEQHEHLAVNTEEVFSSESWAAALPLDRSLLARGIRVRVLSRLPGDGDQGAPPASAAAEAQGMYRQHADLPLKLMIFDRRVALLPADPVNFEAGFVEVTDPPVVQALCGMFHRLWADGRDPFRQGVPPINLTPRENALVALLAAGHTDVTAATRLNVSLRTVAYTLRALMDRLGVQNRFQLALLLGAAGATPLPADTETATGRTMPADAATPVSAVRNHTDDPATGDRPVAGHREGEQ